MSDKLKKLPIYHFLTKIFKKFQNCQNQVKAKLSVTIGLFDILLWKRENNSKQAISLLVEILQNFHIKKVSFLKIIINL